MKTKTFFTFITLSLFAACTLQKSILTDVVSTDQLKRNINSAITEWGSLKAGADLSHENITSWLPDSGVRGKYEITKTYLGKSILETIVGEKAFLSGPHAQGINFRSLKEFGRYNPQFLTKLQMQLNILFSNKTFVNGAQSLYDSQLKNYLRIYYLSYKTAANKQNIMDGYLAAIAKEPEPANPSEAVFLSGPSSYLQDSFGSFSSSLESNYDEYEGVTCPGFWVRRSIDGTSDEFYNLLTMTLNTFDPGFISTVK